MPDEGFGLNIGADYPRLRAAVRGFCWREERAFTAAEIGEQIIHLSHTRDLLTRELAQLVGVFSGTHEAERQGSWSPADWVRHNAKLSVSAAHELQVVGEHLDEMPLSNEALDEGSIGFGHLVQLARNAAFAARSKTGKFDEAPLLPLAKDESVSRFHHTCMSARHAQDPEGYKDAEAAAFESRKLTISPHDDGTTSINALLPSTSAAMVQSVLEARARRLGPDDHRLKEQRMADAFFETMQAPVTEFAGAQPVGRNVHINVTCTAATLLNLPGAPGAEIEFGQPLSGATVGRLACNATFTKILLDDRLIPVAVGHMKRTLTKRERRALNARDGHCRYPGCSRPPSQCEAHHAVWYSRGGKTKLSNMILLCFFHHWRVHEGGWQIALAADGAVVVVPPQLFSLARGPGAAVAA